MAPRRVETDKSRPCGGVLEVEGFEIEGIDVAGPRRSKRTAAALSKQAAEPKQLSRTKATSKSLEVPINEPDHSEPHSNSTTHAARKSRKKAGPKTSTNVVPEESEGSPHRGQPHHQEDPSELAVPDARVRIPLSQRMTTIQEDNEEINPFAPTLPSSSPHILEGPYDFVSPPSTPSHLHSASTPSRPSAGGTMAYRFVHFEEPSVVPSSPAESLSSPSPSLASAPPSPASVSTSPLSSAKDRRDADDVWPFYLEEGDRRVCKLCWAGDKHKNAKEKTYSMSTETTSLRHHLIREHLKLWVSACDRLNTSIKGNGTKAAEKFQKANGMATPSDTSCSDILSVPKFSHDAFIDAIVEWIIADDQSINVIECPQLCRIFLMLCEELTDTDIPHRTFICAWVIQTWERYISTLKGEMEHSMSSISLTMDLSSDLNLVNYMAVTAHWMEPVGTDADGRTIIRLRSDLIGYHCVPGRHEGEHLAAAVLYITDRVGITSKDRKRRLKLGWITMDNAANNGTFMVFLERDLLRRGFYFCAIEKRIRCFAHIVNLAAKAVISAVTALNAVLLEESMDITRDPVAAVRALVRVIRGSSLRQHSFSSVLKTLDKKVLQLILDVDIRWSSTDIMIERAIQLWEGIEVFLGKRNFADLRRHQLSDEEWKALNIIHQILAIPHAFQQKLSADKTPTLSLAIPSFRRMIQIWQNMKVTFPQAASALDEGLAKLETYRERTDVVPAYTLATILNPNAKLRWFSRYMPAEEDEARQLFLRKLREYQSLTSFPPTPARSQIPDPRGNHWADDLLGDNLFDTTMHPQSLEAEVDAYLSDVKTSHDIVKYWQDNQLVYPTIFMMAMDILPIQGTSVPCERVFSSGKETATARRNRLSPELMEALQMLKFAFKRGQFLNFTEGTSKEAEVVALETLLAEQDRVPEDVTAFIEQLHTVD